MDLSFALTSLRDYCLALQVPLPEPTDDPSADIKTMLVRALLSANYWNPDGTLGDGTPAWKREFPAVTKIPVKRGSVKYALQQITDIIPFEI
jgi:hypothetical protein